MSKITFRADDDLVRQIEAFDTSKSEVLRQALREYLASHGQADMSDASTDATAGSIDELVERRVEAVLDERLGQTAPRSAPQDVNVNVTLEGERVASAANAHAQRDASQTRAGESQTTRRHSDDAGDDTADHDHDAGVGAAESDATACAQCGEAIEQDHVYCPNCGEKASRRLFCECGDEIRSDWAFCPGCGRRTPAAGVLDADASNFDR
jgi:RNA polymerase subunit RPABC4/transcription elongation factor Spt4/predicted transcriptional regulator